MLRREDPDVDRLLPLANTEGRSHLKLRDIRRRNHVRRHGSRKFGRYSPEELHSLEVQPDDITVIEGLRSHVTRDAQHGERFLAPLKPDHGLKTQACFAFQRLPTIHRPQIAIMSAGRSFAVALIYFFRDN